MRLRARYSSPFGRVLHLSLANAQRLWVAVCDLGFAALWHADSHDLLSAAPLPLAAPLAAACACELPPSEGAEETVAGVAVLESTGAVSLLGVVWNGEQASVHIRASAPGVLPHDARFPRAPTLLRTRPGISHIVAAQGQRVVSLDKASLAMAWTFDLQDAGLVEVSRCRRRSCARSLSLVSLSLQSPRPLFSLSCSLSQTLARSPGSARRATLCPRWMGLRRASASSSARRRGCSCKSTRQCALNRAMADAAARRLSHSAM